MRRSRVLDPVNLGPFGNGHAFGAPDYVWRSKGDVLFLGTRPPSCTACDFTGTDGSLAVHAHGFLVRLFITVRDGRFVKIKLWKRRWRCIRCRKTSHSRPPDELPRVKACTLCIVLFLHAVLVFAGLGWTMGLPVDTGWICSRTLVRWRDRALAKAAETEESIRKAVEERARLEPEKSLSGRGLSPPEWLLRRPWREPSQVAGLWRGIQLLLSAHLTLSVSCTEILTQARGLTGSSSFLL